MCHPTCKSSSDWRPKAIYVSTLLYEKNYCEDVLQQACQHKSENYNGCAVFTLFGPGVFCMIIFALLLGYTLEQCIFLLSSSTAGQSMIDTVITTTVRCASQACPVRTSDAKLPRTSVLFCAASFYNSIEKYTAARCSRMGRLQRKTDVSSSIFHGFVRRAKTLLVYVLTLEVLYLLLRTFRIELGCQSLQNLHVIARRTMTHKTEIVQEIGWSGLWFCLGLLLVSCVDQR